MANEKSNYDADRFAHGTGGKSDDDAIDPLTMMPGVKGGKRMVLPSTGGDGDAARAEGTTGAIGEMDSVGTPASTTGASSLSGGNSAGETYGGGAGSGSSTSGGTGAGTRKDDPGPQSIESTLAVYDDDSPGDMDSSGTGSAAGAGSRAETDVAGDTAPNR